MKAAVVEEVGKIVFKEVPDPLLLPGSMMIRVEACAVCGSDIRIFRRGDHRASLPRIIGHEIAGIIEEVGEDIGNYNVGDRVTVAPGHGCGDCKYCLNDMANVCINPQPSIGYASSGGFAQYIVPPENVVRNGFVNKIPEGLTFEEASMAELLACCINGQERAEVQKGDNVLIVGAGPAGCMHTELAKANGAAKVMITQRSLPRLEFAKNNLNPDIIISGDGEEVVSRVKEETNGLGADVVIVAAPSAAAQELAFFVTAPRGRINFFGGLPINNNQITIDANKIHYKEIYVSGASSSLGRHNLKALELIKDGLIPAQTFITHRFPLEKTAEAFSVVENKKAIKSVVFPWK